MNKQAYANSEYRKIRNLARPFYLDDGPNSWQHIQEVRRRAAKMMRALEHRSLTPAEYAAVLFHDSTKHDLGGKDHGRMGAARAAKVLAAALPPEQVAEAAEAIAVHDDNLPGFPSRTAELLASADANPPDLDWFLNKAYCWNRAHGNDYEQAMDNIAGNRIAKSNYGRSGKFNWPGIYKAYYGERVPRYQDAIDSLTPDIVRSRLKAYHEKYGIDPENPIVIHNR